MIICAAVKVETTDAFGKPLEDIIICGLRHGDCVKTIKCLDVSITNEVDGFINHKGEFLDRKEAYKHALECGQINQHAKWYREDHNDNTEELYSEDLY